MKLHLQTTSHLNTVKAYSEDSIQINQKKYHASLLLLPDRIIENWALGGFETLCLADFEQIQQLAPKIVLIGTGAQQRFPHPKLLKPLIEAQIGYEIMSLQAACRTYNILMDEERNVLAALLFN